MKIEMVDVSVYAERRARFMQQIGDAAVALFHSPPETLRNGDVHNPFRQSSDILYLTGFAEPGTTVVLRPGAERDRFVMFVRPRDPERETWDGRRAGVEGAIARHGADAAYPVAELAERLGALLANTEDLYYSLGHDDEFDLRVARTIAELRRSDRRGRRAPVRVVDPRGTLHEMRLIKSPEEIATLRRAASITAEAHREAMRATRPGATEYEIEAVIDYAFRRRGGVGPGYPSIVGGGDNATILHYTENCRELRAGDLLLIDAGCEYDYYTADVTRTLPVSGRFSPLQRRCYEIVLEAQLAGIEETRPGATLERIHERCVEILTEGMVELGLLQGPARARIEDESYRQFYMHRTSHWLGMDVHDAGAYTRGGTPRPLEPGMVVTIEPGLYVSADARDVPPALRGVGIRIEDDVLVTRDGRDNLTVETPKLVDEVEAACAG
jgi:Xaa-Pro aminopeptidase